MSCSGSQAQEDKQHTWYSISTAALKVHKLPKSPTYQPLFSAGKKQNLYGGKHKPSDWNRTFQPEPIQQ